MTPKKRVRFVVTELAEDGTLARTLLCWETYSPTWFNCGLAHGHYLVAAAGYNQKKAAKKARDILEKKLDRPFTAEEFVQ